MAKINKLDPSLGEDTVPDNIIELTDMIELKFEEKPKDGRKKKAIRDWRDEINFLINKLNKIAGWKMYNIIKNG